MIAGSVLYICDFFFLPQFSFLTKFVAVFSPKYKNNVDKISTIQVAILKFVETLHCEVYEVLHSPLYELCKGTLSPICGELTSECNWIDIASELA
jgi:hypothetical protein